MLVSRYSSSKNQKHIFTHKDNFVSSSFCNDKYKRSAKTGNTSRFLSLRTVLTLHRR